MKVTINSSHPESVSTFMENSTSAGSLRVSLIPAAGASTASSRIRVFQLEKALSNLGVICEYGFSSAADVLFIQKRVTEEILTQVQAEKSKGKRVIYDVDDLGEALWYWASRPLFEHMLNLADHVTVSTEEQGKILSGGFMGSKTVLRFQTRSTIFLPGQ